MLYQSTNERTQKNNLLLAASTAFVAGITNVAGAMACFSFTANVTGHAASFAKHIISNSWFELFIVFLWLFMFVAGAFTANFLIRSFEHKGTYKAHALPLMIEMMLMCLVGFYGIKYAAQTELFTEILTAALLFTMGLQNSTVSTISGGSIKTSHLTGLFTDLGAEVSEWFHPKAKRTTALKNKLQLRFTILSFYIIGGVAGGILFIQTTFITFFITGFILLLILCYDIFKMKAIKHFNK